MPSRKASHAGSWYSDSPKDLSRMLNGWLDQVPEEIEGVGKLPRDGARVIIAPYVCVFHCLIRVFGRLSNCRSSVCLSVYSIISSTLCLSGWLASRQMIYSIISLFRSTVYLSVKAFHHSIKLSVCPSVYL